LEFPFCPKRATARKTGNRGVRSAYKPYFFSQRTIFLFHNKSANSTFSHGLSAKRTGLLSSWSYMCLVSSFPNTVLEVLYILIHESGGTSYVSSHYTINNENTSAKDGHRVQVAVQVYCSRCRRPRLCGIMLQLCL